MQTRKAFFLLCAAAASAGTLALIGQEAPTEAPAGFTTPPLTQRPQPATLSNGLPEPPGDTFVVDQEQFEREHDPTNPPGTGIQRDRLRLLPPEQRDGRGQPDYRAASWPS
jgi:hypothetical protein